MLENPIVLATVLAVLAGAGPTAAPSVDEVVAAFYPPRLIEEDEHSVSHGDSPGERTQVWVPLTASGDVIVAAYSNGDFGDVRVLSIAEGQWTLLWEPGEMLGGEDPVVETVDLNGDGHLDFVVTFTTGMRRSNVSSLFLFDGRSVTPVSLGDNYNPSFIDLDGDGVMELLDGTLDLDFNPVANIYRLTPDGYTKAEPVLYAGTNGRGDGAQPRPKTEHFLSTVPSATLLILNGVGGFPRSAAVEVYLNGERVISRNQFNETVARVAVPVSLLTEDTPNKITSTVFGKPNAAIDVLVLVAGSKANTNAP